MTSGNVALLLMYEPTTAKGRPVPVARVEDKKLVLEVARAAVRESQERADVMASADELLGEVEHEEAGRLLRTLEILVPEMKPNRPSGVRRCLAALWLS